MTRTVLLQNIAELASCMASAMRTAESPPDELGPMMRDLHARAYETLGPCPEVEALEEQVLYFEKVFVLQWWDCESCGLNSRACGLLSKLRRKCCTDCRHGEART